jgi:hypothetical protein
MYNLIELTSIISDELVRLYKLLNRIIEGRKVLATHVLDTDLELKIFKPPFLQPSLLSL